MKVVQHEAPADSAALDEIVQRIADGFQPQRIILFGSRARGDAAKDSDYEKRPTSKKNCHCEPSILRANL